MAISVDNTYGSLYTNNTAADSIADKLTSQITSADSDEDTLSACQQFESYLIQKMFKNMQESAKIFSDEEEDDSSGDYVDTFSDTYLETIADSMVYSGHGLGVAEQLYESVKNNTNSTAAQTE